MSHPMTILLLLKRVDCNDGIASYCETLIKGLKARGDRVVIVSGPVTQLYGSTTRHSAIRNAVLDWAVLGNLKASRLAPTVI
jgi:phosphoserine phosphatase